MSVADHCNAYAATAAGIYAACTDRTLGINPGDVLVALAMYGAVVLGFIGLVGAIAWAYENFSGKDER